MFDDIGEQSRPAIIQNSYRESNPIQSSSLTSPILDDNAEESGGLLHHLKRFTRSVKRGLFDFWKKEDSDETEDTSTTEAIQEEEDHDLISSSSTLSSSSESK